MADVMADLMADLWLILWLIMSWILWLNMSETLGDVRILLGDVRRVAAGECGAGICRIECVRECVSINAIEARAIVIYNVFARGRLFPLASRTLFCIKNSMVSACMFAVAAVGSFAVCSFMLAFAFSV